MALSNFGNFANIHRLVSDLVQHTSIFNDTETNDYNAKILTEYLYQSSLNETENEDSVESNVTSLNQDPFSLLSKCDDRISRRYNDLRFTQLIHLYNKMGSSAYSDRFIKFLLLLSNDSPKLHFIDSHDILDSVVPAAAFSLRTARYTYPLPVVMSTDISVSSEQSVELMKEEYSPASFYLLEARLVCDLVENLLGREGSLIKCSLVDRTPRFEITISPTIPSSLLRRAMSIIKLVCCFLHIQRILVEMSNSSSAVVYSLISAVRNHLQEYSEYVCLYTEEQTAPYSIRSLLLYIHEPMYCTNRVCSLLETWVRNEETGGTLLNQVYRATFTGCQRMRRILSSFLEELMIPLQFLLHKWVCLGELDGEQVDFFISRNQDEKENTWENEYSINNANLPEFISLHVAGKILIAGKSVCFLRRVCNESTDTFSRMTRGLDGFNLSFESVLDGTFENTIHQIYLEQSAHLMRVLEDTFQLKMHLRGFQDFFLMARGDFAFLFLTEAKELLDASLPHVHLQELRQVFSLSLLRTTAKRCPKDVVDRLEVILSSEDTGEVGWSVLNLDYILTPPLDTIFPPPTILAYQSIFKVLLNIRKSELVLSSLWRQLSLYFRQVTEDYDLTQLYFSSHFFVNCMLHFIKKIQFYVCDIFTFHWRDLSRSLYGCADLDQLKYKHSNYLDVLRAGCYLVSPPGTITSGEVKLKYLDILSELNAMCLSLLDAINSADVTIQTMFRDLDLEFEAKHQSEKRIESSGWGTCDSIEQKEVERIDEFLNKMQITDKTIQQQNTKFNHTVQSLVKLVYKNPVLNLRRLAVSLNFNGYYRNNTFTC